MDYIEVLDSIDAAVWGPPMIILLLGCHIYTTIRTKGIQRKLPLALKLSITKDNGAQGDVSNFGAMATSLASTLGTGSIVGVATAVLSGGPGAVLWMWLTGILGMATKYTEVYAAMKYRVKDRQGHMMGGAMHVWEQRYKRPDGTVPWWAKFMAIWFAVMACLTIFGVGSAVQTSAITSVAQANFGVEPWIVAAIVCGSALLIIRNTARYCLGNLDGFDANDLVKPEDMHELDKWAITKLNKLIEKAFAAYDEYEFHVVSHLINDFCVVELSNFYLDIIKDRLYCSGKNSLERRSAQTALFLILDTLTKMFAPILAFTCDEIWLAMPHRSEDDVRNVVLNEMNKPFAEYALDDAEMAKWDALISVRNDVNGVLEKARADKRIGKPLEASVTLRANGESKAVLDKVSDMDLKELLIVSECLIAEDDAADAAAVTASGSYNPGLTVSVKEAEGTKCPRCWMHSVDADPETGLCPRCKSVLEALF